jgi:chromosome segregation ATPase
LLRFLLPIGWIGNLEVPHMFGQDQKYNVEMIAELTKNLTLALAKITELEERVNALEYTQNLEEKIDELETRMGDLEGDRIDDPSDQIADLDDRMSELQSDVDDLIDLPRQFKQLQEKVAKYDVERLNSK